MASELRVDRIIPVNGVPTGGGGGIVKMVQSKFPSSVSTSVQTTWINNHSISITPTSASNKVLFMWNGEIYGGGVGILRVSGRVRRGSSTTIWENSDLYFRESSAQMKAVCSSICYLDSPATTSSVTYYFDSYIIQGLEWFMDADANFLTLMEVSG